MWRKRVIHVSSIIFCDNDACLISLLAVFFEDFNTFVISTLLFGMSNLGIVSLTMTLAGRLNPANASKEMARLTFGFALALIIGPFFTGVLAEYSGSYDVPILIAGCLMLLGGF